MQKDQVEHNDIPDPFTDLAHKVTLSLQQRCRRRGHGDPELGRRVSPHREHAI